MSELTLDPGAAAVAPVADKPLAVPALALAAVPDLNARRRAELRLRRRFTATRPLYSSDGGFRLFRVY